MNPDLTNILDRLTKLEAKALQVQLQPTEQENLKNNLFEGFSDTPPSGAKSTYIKVNWKNQPYYIPTGKISGGAVVALTDSSTVATDASAGGLFTLTATQNFTMSNPTNPIDGQIIIYKIKQDAGGGNVITWDTAFRGSLDVALPVLTTTGDYVDYVMFIYDSSVSKFNCLATNLGFAS